MNGPALLLEAIAAPVALLDSSGRITAANQTWTALRAPAEDQNCFAVWPADADAMRRVFDGSLDELTFDAALESESGRRRMRMTLRRVPGDASAIITAEPSDEGELSAARAELSALYDGVDEAIVVINVAGEGEYRFAAMNERMSELIGVPSNGGIRRLDDIAPPDSVARIIAHCDEVLRTRRPVQWRAVATYPSGRIDVDVTLSPLLERDGSCSRLVAIVRDETELARREEARVAAEQQAEMQHRSFHLALAALSDLVYVFDREGRFTYASQPLLDLLGRQSAEVIGKDVRELGYPEPVADQVLRDIARVVATGQQVRGETPFSGRDHTEGYYEYILHAVFDEDGRVHAVAGSSRDVSDRKRVEQELLRHAEKQRALTEQLEIEHARLAQAQAVAKLGSWIFDFATQTVTWSDETYRICGLSKADDPRLYAAFRERIHPDDLDAFDRAGDNATAGVPYVFEHRVVMPDGTTKWVQERCDFVRASDGTLLRAIGTIQDISDRKAAETALQHSQRLLRIASTVGHVGGWAVDLTNMTVSWSDEVCAIHGMPPGYSPSVEEAINFYVPEDRPRLQAAVAECVATASPFDLEARIVDTRGKRVWVRSIGEAAVDHNGTVVGVHGAFQDISEMKQVLDALRASDERFRLVAQATSDVVWDYDLSHDVLWWSEGLRTQFGHDVAVTGADFWSDHIHPDDRQRVADAFDAAISTARLWRDEYRFRKADGTYAQVIDRAFIVRDGAGGVPRAVGSIVDVTQQRALESQLQQIQRVASLGQLAANMAHEFNNVLMGIQPFAEILRRIAEDLPMAQEATRHIVQSVRRGKKVTEEILRFTRRVEPTFRPVEVGEWLRGFHAEAVGLVGEAIEVELRLPEAPLHLEGDLSQLNQVLANLLINARDASAPGSRVIVGAALTDEPLVSGGERGVIDVTVQDFGTGMDRATIERIFEPLFTTKPSGTGLGLAISTQVVRVHGGAIRVESEPGVGTTFHLLFPVGRAGELPGRIAVTEPGELPPAKALIVEDDESVAMGITLLLDTERVSTAVVTTGAQAIAAIERLSPDVVFLDIGLPDISGVDVFQQIHGRWPHLRVVLMTGHYSASELQSILTLPHVAFLQKPFGAEAIRHVLKATHERTRAKYDGPPSGAVA